MKIDTPMGGSPFSKDPVATLLSFREILFLGTLKSIASSESELRTVNYLSNREYESRASATDLLSRVIRSDIHDLRPLGRVVVRSSDG